MATNPVSRPLPQSSFYKTVNRTPRNTTTYSVGILTLENW